MPAMKSVRIPLFFALWLSASAFAAETEQDAADAIKSQDYERAVEIMLPLAEAGSRFAQYNLGVFYEEGIGVEPDAAEAYKWTLLAAKQDDIDAIVRLASMQRDGIGTAQDLEASAQNFLLAAENGNVHGQSNMAHAYLNGIGVARDLEKAAYWLEAAANQGHAHSQYTFAAMLVRGAGVEKDVARGTEYLRRAAAQGHEGAISVLGAAKPK